MKKKISLMGTEYEAYKIIKGDTSIIGYDEQGILLFGFTGIASFEDYLLPEGETWDTLAGIIPLTLEEEKAKAIRRIKDSCEAAIFAGFIYTDGKVYEYDLKDQSRFQSIMIAILTGQTGNLEWGTKDGSLVIYNETTYPPLYAASLAHLQTNIDKSRIYEDLINAATTKEEWDAIIWE